jgi:hypothetical protein
MRTSSGDVINMDFANEQSASFMQQNSEGSSKTSMNFSSMQSFSFSIDSNGISKQDQKEIDAFMELAQPYIDKFIKEFEDVAPKTPVTQMAKDIAAIFDPQKDRDENSKNFVKSNIVDMFDNTMKKLEIPEKPDTQELLEQIYENTKKLLEKTLKEFDNFNKELYA